VLCGKLKIDVDHNFRPTKSRVGEKSACYDRLRPRVNDEVRVEPKDHVEDWRLGKEGQNTRLKRSGVDKRDSKQKLRSFRMYDCKHARARPQGNDTQTCHMQKIQTSFS